MHNILQYSYAALVLLLLATIVGYGYGHQFGYEWLKDLSLNLGTEILGIFLTVVLIDAVIRRNEERERLRVRKVAFQQLQTPLIHQLQVLHGIYKASIQHAPEEKEMPSEVRELFTDSYFSQIAFLDFSKPAPLATVAPLQWMDYLRIESEKFKVSLSRTLEKYAVFLEGDTVESIESLINSDFLTFLSNMVAIRELDRKENLERNYNFFAGQGMEELIRNYTLRFTKLIDLYNKTAARDQLIMLNPGYWRNDIAPQIGSARTPLH